jgi:hypothetical protein
VWKRRRRSTGAIPSALSPRGIDSRQQPGHLVGLSQGQQGTRERQPSPVRDLRIGQQPAEDRDGVGRPPLAQEPVGVFQLEDARGRYQLRQPRPQLGGGQRAHELVHDLATAERLDRGDALHAEAGGQVWILVGVDLHQRYPPVQGRHLALEDGPEHTARAAPRRPEIHDHRKLGRTLEHVTGESRLVGVDHIRHAANLPRGSRHVNRRRVLGWRSNLPRRGGAPV